ncbi:MAG: 50S ribosomal protein L18 [Candidatus Pacearchaeota archaeon]|nr:50S ribosomal protein L18 [Candidatus Pacearchaeota archaeon]
MTRKKLIRVAFRRRLEGKTDYKRRCLLLRAGLPRIVIRKTNKYIITQIVKSREAQDFTACYAHSKELGKMGWKFSFKNLPAAYLTGVLIAKKAREKGIKKAIIDIGLHRSTKGSKIYAAIRGAIDGGLEVGCDERVLPTEERIRGAHTKNADALSRIFERIKTTLMK